MGPAYWSEIAELRQMDSEYKQGPWGAPSFLGGVPGKQNCSPSRIFAKFTTREGVIARKEIE